MTDLKFCRRCLYSEVHPLNIIIGDDGLCSGCYVHEEKNQLDWTVRWEMLKTLTNEFKVKSGRQYDCIVPVNGGADSYFTVHVVKNLLGLNPLLASYNNHYNTPLGIRNLAYLRIAFNVDMVQRTVQPQTIRNLNRATLQSMGSMYWHIQAGRTAFPVQTAVNYGIPLIIWGAHQGVDQVGMFSHLEEVEMTRKYRKDHDLMGMEVEDLVAQHDFLNHEDLESFYYPDDRDIQALGIRGIYLNNYLRWDSKAQHELMINEFGFETSTQARTFDTYNTTYCHHHSGLHDQIKFAKWGFGKATDHACREIRLNRLTRQAGIELVNRYSQVNATDESLFLEWQGISREELWEYIDLHRHPRIWQRDGKEWVLQANAATSPSEGDTKPTQACHFKITPSRNPTENKEQYILIGRGYVDGQGPHSPPKKKWNFHTAETK